MGRRGGPRGGPVTLSSLLDLSELSGSGGGALRLRGKLPLLLPVLLVLGPLPGSLFIGWGRLNRVVTYYRYAWSS